MTLHREDPVLVQCKRVTTMSVDDEPAQPSGDPLVPSEAVVNANSALRLLMGLLALWTLLSGLALVFFQGASEATTGGGLSGSEANAAQRLLGVHMLVLAPIYGLLAWEPRRYRLLLWVPYVALGLTLAVSVFDILTGERDFQDGALPFVVNLVFFALLVYVWRSSRAGESRIASDHSDVSPEPEPQRTAPPSSLADPPLPVEPEHRQRSS
jgi:hypothetical protein